MLILTTVATNVLRIVNTMLLTRLLSPRDFGLAGMIFSIFFVVGMLTEVGFYSFVVRHERGSEPEFLNSIWTVHATRGFAICITVAVLSWPIALLLGKAALAPLLAVAAISFVFEGVTSLATLTAAREGLVSRLSLVEFGAFLIQLAIGVLAAWLLRNAWAIVIATLVYGAMRAIGSYLFFPHVRHRVRYDRTIASELWRFSRLIAASSMLTLAIAQIDKLVLARLFTLPEFGVYAVAANLAAAPVALAMMYTSRMVFPGIAEAWRRTPERVGDAIYDRGIVFYGYALAAGGLVGCAPFVVRLLYDPRYEYAGVYLRLLAIATALTMLTRAMDEALIAIGQIKSTLMMNAVRIGWLAAAGIGGLLAFGPIGLVGALGLVELPAYGYAAWALGRQGLYRPRADVPVAAILLAGFGAGYVVDRLSLSLFLGL